MDDTTKTFNNRKGLKITWGNATVIITIGVLIASFLIDRGRRLQQFETHKTEMIAMQSKLEKLQKWQTDWPTTGKLALDGVQNTRLDEHDRRIGVLEK